MELLSSHELCTSFPEVETISIFMFDIKAVDLTLWHTLFFDSLLRRLIKEIRFITLIGTYVDDMSRTRGQDPF